MRGAKSDLAVQLCAAGRFRMKPVTDTLGLARSNIAERVKGVRLKRGPQTGDGDLELTAAIRRLVDARSTYRYRRIAALLKRERRSDGLAPRSKIACVEEGNQNKMPLWWCRSAAPGGEAREGV